MLRPGTRLCIGDNGAVLWPMPANQLPELPATLRVDGRVLQRKSEFHITVLGALPGDDRDKERTAPDLAASVQTCALQPDQVELLDELWLLEKSGAAGVDQTIAVACRAAAFEQARAALARLAGIELSPAPAHITLFTSGSNGIGVADFDELQQRRIAAGTWRSFGLGHASD